MYISVVLVHKPLKPTLALDAELRLLAVVGHLVLTDVQHGGDVLLLAELILMEDTVHEELLCVNNRPCTALLPFFDAGNGGATDFGAPSKDNLKILHDGSTYLLSFFALGFLPCLGLLTVAILEDSPSTFSTVSS